MKPIDIVLFAAMAYECLELVHCLHGFLTFSVANKTIDKLAVDKTTGTLFVGATNALYRLSADLEEQETFRIGPNNESVSRICKPFQRDCIFSRNDSFHLVANKVSIIKLYEGQDFFLVCETQHNGLCAIQRNKNKLTDRTYLYREESYLNHNLIGSRNHVVMLADYNSSSTASFFDSNKHFVALSYDGKPEQYHTHEFATLKLRKFEDRDITYTFREDVVEKSFMDVGQSHKEDFTLKIIYGFETTMHVYFVFIRSTNTEAMVETKIARICKSDRYYYSYVEIPITCTDPVKKSSYRLASAGYYLSANEALFLAFGSRTHNSGEELDPSEGSVVCAYTLLDVNAIYFHSIFDCYSGNDCTRPSWSSRNPGQPCVAEDRTLSFYFCGARVNPGMECSSFKIDEKLIFQLPPSRVVSAVYVTGGAQSSLILGTNDGYMIKAKIVTKEVDGQNKTWTEKYAEFDVSGDRTVPVSREISADPSQEHLYFITGNKITKIPLYSCAVHVDCGTCILSKDHLECGWCGYECTLQEECRSSNFTWHNESCPPVISRVSPLSGPVHGRTLLTIQGERFGGTNQSLSVTTGPVKCDVEEHTDTKILCRTRSVANSSSLPVIVEADDFSRTDHKFNISGKAELLMFDFTFLVPAVLQIHPIEGAVLGKNLLTITGQNLNIGSSLKVYVSESFIGCDVISKDYEQIICRLATYVETIGGSYGNRSEEKPSECVGYGHVEIHIDGAVVKSEDTYCYKPNPKVQLITPLKTIQSGGNTIFIHGEHLDTFTNHTLVLWPSNLTVDCQLISGSLVKCKYPSFPLMNFPGDGQMQVLMGGFSDFNGKNWTFEVFADPVFQRLTSETSLTPIKDEKLILQLLGEGLDNALTIADYNVTVDEFECIILELKDTYLKCDLDEAMKISSYLKSSTVMEVKIQAGNIHQTIGNLRLNKLDNSDRLHKTYKILAGVLGVFLFFCVVICCVFKRKHLPPFKKHLRRFQEADLMPDPMTFQNLMSRVENDEPSSAVPNNYTNIGTEEAGAVGGDPAPQVDSGTLYLLEKQNLLVDREYLVLGESIGHGQFGCVYKGYLTNPKEKAEKLVAVKTILKTSTSSEINIHEFLNEAMIMKDFSHPNVLSLIGVCLDRGEFPLVILPFMENGDLLTYIRNEKNNPKVRDLVSVGLDIGRGMEYLSGIQFVHRDLAARNCMLDGEMVAKVADFGLSRDIYSDHYYRSDNKKKLPVKWMAPESLQHGKYTAKSDVWSFGVVIWELMTRGASPYNEVDNWDMFRYLKEGRRLPRPLYCPIELYDIMQKCWNFHAPKRPTFKQLVEDVNSILSASERGGKIGDVMLDLDSTTSTG